MAKTCRCGGQTSVKNINIDRNINGNHITFNNVPVLVCNKCNEKYLSAKVLKRMDFLLNKHPGKNELNYEVDQKEHTTFLIIKELERNNFIQPNQEMDMPASVLDVYIAMGRLATLREEQIYLN